MVEGKRQTVKGRQTAKGKRQKVEQGGEAGEADGGQKAQSL
jgi:hypothetical protein